MEDKKPLIPEVIKKEDELQLVIQHIMNYYVHTDFRENVDKFDEDMKKIFSIYENGKYVYHGLDSKLGVWNDVVLLYDLKEEEK